MAKNLYAVNNLLVFSSHFNILEFKLELMKNWHLHGLKPSHAPGNCLQLQTPEEFGTAQFFSSSSHNCLAL